MRIHDKKQKVCQDNTAASGGTASFEPKPFQLKGAEKTPSGKSLCSQAERQLLQKDPDQLSPEEKYHHALIMADYRPENVQGFDEFKPGGFRYNHGKAYNLQILKAKGQANLRARIIGEYWADPETKTGNVMLTHHQRQSSLGHIASGNTYKPKKETINRQNVEHLGEEGVKRMAIDQLGYCQRIRQAIAMKINDPCISEKEKNSYLAKDAKILAAANRLLCSIGTATGQQIPEAEQAGYAIPVTLALEALIAAGIAGTAIYTLGNVIYGLVQETLNDVVDAALDDLLRDTGVKRAGKDEPRPKPTPDKNPQPIPVGNGEKDEEDKPLKWDSKPVVEKVIASKGLVGALNENKVQKNKTVDHSWHAHHPWPKFMGGKEEQPLMGVKGYVHKSVVHPLLTTYLKSKGYKLVVNGSPEVEPNLGFVERLRNDPIFKAEVMDDLLRFHASLNSITSPTIPRKAYGLGIEYSFKNIYR